MQCDYYHKNGYDRKFCINLKQDLEERKNQKKSTNEASVLKVKDEDNKFEVNLLSVLKSKILLKKW